MSTGHRSNRQGAPASSSPALPDQYEVLYNSAVQSFVRRDHVKTQATLARLLALTRSLPRDTQPWYDLTPSTDANAAAHKTSDEWVTKTLKLAMSANASMYSDPPRKNDQMQHLLPPAPPTAMLEHIRDLCVSTYGAPLLPPQLVSTFLLAALKLRPSEPALTFAHNLAENWLADLPDEFILGIASESRGANRKRVEVAREGYLKVVELFVGEVLGREGEWEMARGLLEGDMVMGSKKKEALYRHLRQLQTRPVSQPQSPANSGILPTAASDDSVPPTPTHKGKRSRLSSTSSSSSEATARPAGVTFGDDRLGALRSVSGNAKGKAREAQSEGGDSTVHAPQSEASTAMPLPSKIYVRPSGSGSNGEGDAGPSRNRPRNSVLRSTLAFLPAPLAVRLEELWRSGWLSSVLVPLPIIVVLLLIAHRRQQARNRGAVTTVRDRLRRARMQGLGPWIMLWVKWWMDKVAGIWKLGTTITYM